MFEADDDDDYDPRTFDPENPKCVRCDSGNIKLIQSQEWPNTYECLDCGEKFDENHWELSNDRCLTSDDYLNLDLYDDDFRDLYDEDF